MDIFLTPNDKDTLRNEINTAKRIRLWFNVLTTKINNTLNIKPTFYKQDTEPTNVVNGSLWFNTTLKENIDGDWIDITTIPNEDILNNQISVSNRLTNLEETYVNNN